MIATRSCPYTRCMIVEQRLRWWGLANFWRVPLRHGPVFQHAPRSARRAPSRACRLHAARWKRRRFVQALRKRRGSAVR
jgi:hypothetical protein